MQTFPPFLQFDRNKSLYRNIPPNERNNGIFLIHLIPHIFINRFNYAIDYLRAMKLMIVNALCYIFKKINEKNNSRVY